MIEQLFLTCTAIPTSSYAQPLPVVRQLSAAAGRKAPYDLPEQVAVSHRRHVEQHDAVPLQLLHAGVGVQTLDGATLVRLLGLWELHNTHVSTRISSTVQYGCNSDVQAEMSCLHAL